MRRAGITGREELVAFTGGGLGVAMKLTEPDAPTTTPALVPGKGIPAATAAGQRFAAAPSAGPSEVAPDDEAGSSQVHRLSWQGRSDDAEPSPSATPPSLAFVTEEPPRPPVSARAAVQLAVAVVIAAVLWAIGSSISSGPSRSQRTPVRLTPAEQRASAATRARAAAIAKARRDRGTDAELQDTIPAVTPAPAGR
jgi:hypothetical protein